MTMRQIEELSPQELKEILFLLKQDRPNLIINLYNLSAETLNELKLTFKL
jgi:hypothetical protein